MHGRVAARVAAVVAASSAVGATVALAPGCNPLFGIVSRTNGPTWCELEAQAGGIYCNDFDYPSSTATSQETNYTSNGTFEVTDAMSSSPPNSLVAVTTPPTDPDAGAFVGKLINLTMPIAGSVVCRVDVQPSEIAAAAAAVGDGGAVAIAALGQALVGKNGNPVPFVAVLAENGHLGARLASIGPNGGLGAAVGQECPTLVPTTGVSATQTWTTLEVVIGPPNTMIRSMGAGPARDAGLCYYLDKGPPKPLRDAGSPTEDAATPGYFFGIRYEGFENGLYVPPQHSGLGMMPGSSQFNFAYGIAVHGTSGQPIQMHFDNAECVPLEGGLGGP